MRNKDFLKLLFLTLALFGYIVGLVYILFNFIIYL
nr:MAG TPA: hypothetical protein [Caudoviricetes sp.]DAX07302.1 MAG TPA: hypothetical protein [Caudoviricetes sp.]